MANNRMALVCIDCNVGIAIAKFYHSGGFIAGEGAGWYVPNDRTESMNDFFERHQHEQDKSMFGGNQYRIDYEVNGGDWKYEKSLS